MRRYGVQMSLGTVAKSPEQAEDSVGIATLMLQPKETAFALGARRPKELTNHPSRTRPIMRERLTLWTSYNGYQDRFLQAIFPDWQNQAFFAQANLLKAPVDADPTPRISTPAQGLLCVDCGVSATARQRRKDARAGGRAFLVVDDVGDEGPEQALIELMLGPPTKAMQTSAANHQCVLPAVRAGRGGGLGCMASPRSKSGWGRSSIRLVDGCGARVPAADGDQHQAGSRRVPGA